VGVWVRGLQGEVGEGGGLLACALLWLSRETDLEAPVLRRARALPGRVPSGMAGGAAPLRDTSGVLVLGYFFVFSAVTCLVPWCAGALASCALGGTSVLLGSCAPWGVCFWGVGG